MVSGSSRGLATMLSPTHTASYPAWSASRAIVQHSSTGGRRADCMTTPRVGIEDPDAHHAEREGERPVGLPVGRGRDDDGAAVHAEPPEEAAARRRLTALITAFSDAARMLSSMPTPHRTVPSSAWAST